MDGHESGYLTMQEAAEHGTRLEQLRELLIRIGGKIDECMDGEGIGKMAPLAKQYRETLKEITELEKDGGEPDDPIAAITSRRESAGKPGAVR